MTYQPQDEEREKQAMGWYYWVDQGYEL